MNLLILFLFQGRKEKSKYGYVVRKNLDFDKAELLLYEAVEKMPPFSRKTLVFVSPAGIPKRTLVHRLVDSNHDMFGRPVPRKLRIILIFGIEGKQKFHFILQLQVDLKTTMK